jgi:hypothetical protein
MYGHMATAAGTSSNRTRSSPKNPKTKGLSRTYGPVPNICGQYLVNYPEPARLAQMSNVSRRCGAVNGRDQCERIGSLCVRRPRMINSSVEVLQAEDHSLALAAFGDPRQGVFSFHPHVATDHIHRSDWQASTCCPGRCHAGSVKECQAGPRRGSTSPRWRGAHRPSGSVRSPVTYPVIEENRALVDRKPSMSCLVQS